MRRALGLTIVMLMALVGCKDKAEPWYLECEALEQEGRLERALHACGSAVSADPDSAFGKKANLKRADIGSAILRAAEIVPPTVTSEWCARLSARLLPRLTEQAKAASPNMNGTFVEESVRQHVENLQYNCLKDVGLPTAGEWTCRWNQTYSSAKECDNLRNK